MKQKWIGLARVKSMPGNQSLGKAKGPFVNVIAFADDAEDFVRSARGALEEQGLDPVNIEDVELVSNRALHDDLSPEMLALASTVTEIHPVALATCHSYET